MTEYRGLVFEFSRRVARLTLEERIAVWRDLQQRLWSLRLMRWAARVWVFLGDEGGAVGGTAE